MADTPAHYDDVRELGLLYDASPIYAARPDVPFYLDEAADVDGPILELGCGTGRILLPLARAGHRVVGVDGSAEMIARCAANLVREPIEVQQRVQLFQADVRAFDLGVSFALALMPFRVLQHLVTIPDQLAALGTVARHLDLGGHLTFDVFNPKYSALVAADGVEREDTPETPLPDGRTVRRTARVVRVRFAEQTSEIELAYYLGDERRVHAFDMRWFTHAELEHLLARSGFAIEGVWGDFARGPLIDGAPEMIVRAVRA